MNIIPSEITNFNRTDRELQAFWLFCLMVAGKNAEQTAKKLAKMVEGMPEDKNPFDLIKNYEIHNWLVSHRVGQYGRLEQAIRQSLNLDLRNATLDELMSIHGVGPKTARFFILHSRKDCNVAVLDTHILAWMKAYGVANVPDSTPSGVKYLELEKRFLEICRVMFTDVPIANVDLAIWKSMRMKIGQGN